MSDTSRVAVYIDFDNVVISRYDNVHGDGSWRQDNARRHGRAADSNDPVDLRLAEAEVDIGAIIDYASSFGTVAITRAYADWSVPANAAYKRQLIDRAVDLVQSRLRRPQERRRHPAVRGRRRRPLPAR